MKYCDTLRLFPYFSRPDNPKCIICESYMKYLYINSSYIELSKQWSLVLSYFLDMQKITTARFIVKGGCWHHQIIKPLTWEVSCVSKWHGLKTQLKSVVDEFGCRNKLSEGYNANNACLLMCCNVTCKASECFLKRKWRHVQENWLYWQRQASHIFNCPMT